ncbi:hypothetical protein GJ496_000928 [Pomphorhynchus laevis]|nr:hypothetical protein GJ496_000928 [Pomphorhynchus laevis]
MSSPRRWISSSGPVIFCLEDKSEALFIRIVIATAFAIFVDIQYFLYSHSVFRQVQSTFAGQLDANPNDIPAQIINRTSTSALPTLSTPNISILSTSEPSTSSSAPVPPAKDSTFDYKTVIIIIETIIIILLLLCTCCIPLILYIKKRRNDNEESVSSYDNAVVAPVTDIKKSKSKKSSYLSGISEPSQGQSNPCIPVFKDKSRENKR